MSGISEVRLENCINELPEYEIIFFANEHVAWYIVYAVGNDKLDSNKGV